MKRLFLETQHLIPSLRKLPSHTDRSDSIRRIEAAGEPAAGFCLISVTAGGGPDAVVADSAVSRLLEPVPPLDRVELDRMARQNARDDTHPLTEWHRLRVAGLPALDRHPEGWAARAVTARHPHGYVREAAIQRLSAAAIDRSLPILLQATAAADPEVASLAGDCLPGLLATQPSGRPRGSSRRFQRR